MKPFPNPYLVEAQKNIDYIGGDIIKYTTDPNTKKILINHGFNKNLAGTTSSTKFLALDFYTSKDFKYVNILNLDNLRLLKGFWILRFEKDSSFNRSKE